jgi:hypothetical protein
MQPLKKALINYGYNEGVDSLTVRSHLSKILDRGKI